MAGIGAGRRVSGRPQPRLLRGAAGSPTLPGHRARPQPAPASSDREVGVTDFLRTENRPRGPEGAPPVTCLMSSSEPIINPPRALTGTSDWLRLEIRRRLLQGGPGPRPAPAGDPARVPPRRQHTPCWAGGVTEAQLRRLAASGGGCRCLGFAHPGRPQIHPQPPWTMQQQPWETLSSGQEDQGPVSAFGVERGLGASP